ncbi:MAG: hypothetical protein JWM32_1361 [Verrucomicrobia bacterium]|nr:hypothetical protein [Verrucomicrobiota bacterium]
MFGWLKRFFRDEATAAGRRGAAGERHAAEFLKRERGFKIVARNWRSARDRRAEIDLVCRDREVLVFVEVKTRAPDALVPGFHAVTPRKKRAMRRACMAYLAQLPRRPRVFRFDVVEVSLGPDDGARPAPPAILHFENIPLFAKYYLG